MSVDPIYNRVVASDSQGRLSEGVMKWLDAQRYISGTDLNTMLESGTHAIFTTDNVVNGPGISGPARLTITGHASGVVQQKYDLWGAEPRTLVRNAQSGVFGPWKRADISPREVPTGSDLDTLVEPGPYRISQNTTQANWPEGYQNYAATMDVKHTEFNYANDSANVYQYLTLYTPSPLELFRSKPRGGSWTSWVPLDGSLYPSSEHAVRRSELLRRRAPVTRRGRGIVVFVFDHGLTNFKYGIWPLIKTRNLPVTCAINPGLMTSDPKNSGATWADLKQWSSFGLVEPANHGDMHQDKVILDSAVREYRTARETIETNMGEPVDSFVSANSYWGSTIEDLANHPRGRVCMESHAVITGMMQGVDRLWPITGQDIIGGGTGVWIDKGGATVDDAIGLAQKAYEQGKICYIRFHPEFLDTTGMITTAELTRLFNSIASMRDNNLIDVMQMRDASIALPSDDDTGWRVLSSWGADGVVSGLPLPAGATPLLGSAGYVRVRRIKDKVQFYVRSIRSTNTSITFNMEYGVPIEFLTSQYYTKSIIDAGGSYSTRVENGYNNVSISTTGGVPAQVGTIGAMLEFPTERPRPKSYPGTPA